MIWVFIVLSYLSLFILGFSDNIRGPVFPKVLEAFQLTDGQGSWVFAISSFLGFFGSLVAGRALHLFRKVKVLSAALLLLSGAMVVMALAPSYLVFLFGSALLGFAIGVMGVAQNTLVAIGAPAERRSQVLSGLHAMYGLASLIAPLAVSSLLGAGQAWQSVFFLAAAGGLVVFGATLIWRGPQFEGGTEDMRRSQSEPGQVLAAMILGSYVVAEIMVSTRLTLFVSRYSGESVESASLMVAYFFILLLSGRVLAAVVRLPFSLEAQLKISLVSSFALILLGLQGWAWGFVLSGLAMAPFYPLAISFISQAFPQSLEGAIAKTMAAQSFLVVVMHFSVGYLSDVFGLKTAMAVGPLFLVISFVCLVVFKRKYPR